MRRLAAALVILVGCGLWSSFSKAAEPVTPACVEASAGDGWYSVARSITPDWWASATQAQKDAFAGYLANANGVAGPAAPLYVGQLVCFNPAEVSSSSSTTTSSTTSTTATTQPGTTTTEPPATTVASTTTSSPASTSTTSSSTTSTVPSSGGFPDASSTGPTGTLTAYTGPTNITTAGTVIDHKSVTSCIQISAANVVIRNSLIRCAGTPILLLDDASTYNGRASLLVEDSEIDCRLSPGSTGIAEAHVVARRVDIYGCENGLSINQDVTLEDSYIHNLYNTGEAHSDDIQLSFGHWVGGGYVCCALNVTIRHNTLYSTGISGDLGSSAITANKAPDENVLIDGNLMAGGSYTIYCDQFGSTGINFRVTNNHFSTRFSPIIGAFGVSDECGDETQSGNVVHETGQPIHLG